LQARYWPQYGETPIAEIANTVLVSLANDLSNWQLKPSGTEGYRTAEVTLCGVDTDHVSSKTMECKNQSGLYFVGEVLDVTGHLGGYNFQWAWASGYAAGCYV
jgi:predicted flavoprotein YhiN